MTNLREMLTKELLTMFAQKKEDVLNSLSDNFEKYYSGSHDDIEKILEFTIFCNNLVEHLVNRDISMDIAISEGSKRNDSIDLILKHYEIDKIFNPDKAGRWLINALVMSVRDDYKFNGVRFIKGEKSVLKPFILKKK